MKTTVIASRVIDPREPSLFVKRKMSDPAQHLVVSCSCESCPLLAQKTCVMLMILGPKCPYGTWHEEDGPTRRAAKFSTWVAERKAMHPGIGWHLESPPKRLAFIGDYVYLPYPHVGMCKAVAFLRHSAAFVSGSPFVKREHWTIENVLALIDFRPTALFGGEIASYQKESVPLLIQHIRELDAGMWSQLIAARPELNKAPNYIGRKALVKSLAFPITIPPYHKEYQVTWEWNGKTLTTTSIHAYGSTWGHIKAKSVATEVVPADNAEVVVQSNEWVTPTTVFVD